MDKGLIKDGQRVDTGWVKDRYRMDKRVDKGWIKGG